MYDQIFYLSQQDAELTALVGTKVFPMAVPQRKAPPFVVFNVDDENEIVTMSGPSGIFNCVVTMTSWATTPLASKTLASKVRKAIKGKSGTIQGLEVQYLFPSDGGQDVFEQDEGKDTGLYGFQQSFRCWYRQTN